MTEKIEQHANEKSLGRLIGVVKTARFYELTYEGGEKGRLSLLDEHLFRLQIDPSGEFLPLKNDFVQTEADDDPNCFMQSHLLVTDEAFTIQAGSCSIRLQRQPALISLYDESLHRYRMHQARPIAFDQTHSLEYLKQDANEFYYGGGMQNGAFSHKGHLIKIKNSGLTGKGAAAEPVPFFWSNAGFGELRHTFSAGVYDFGMTRADLTCLAHESPVFDNFYLIGNSPADLIAGYYRLTGQPQFIDPDFLGTGYLNDFQDGIWQKAKPQDRQAIKFENGEYYLPALNEPEKPDDQKAALTGTDDDPLTAQAMIRRFLRNDMPLSWFIGDFMSETPVQPDQADALTAFARTKNVKLGWQTRSDAKSLRFIDPQQAKAGYTDLITALQTAAAQQNQPDQRTLAMTSNGWAGYQHSAVSLEGGLGGQWESLRTQIVSLLSAGLSGQPLAGFAVDGLYGGGNAQVSLRDLEWKVFTPLLFFMDGQSRQAKTPFAYNAKMTRLQRAYLHLRQRLIPYLYLLTAQAQDGQPIVRPLFLAFPHEKFNYTQDCGHEFMLGSDLLIAPILDGRENLAGQAIKDNLYLPDHRTIWTDLFTGEKYAGGSVMNRLPFSSWHLPVFVRGGAILNLGPRDYLIYPSGKTSRVFYEDDGHSLAYQNGAFATTRITSDYHQTRLNLRIAATQGHYAQMPTQQPTVLTILTDRYPGSVHLKCNDKVTSLTELPNLQRFKEANEGFYYDPDFSPVPEFEAFGAPHQAALRIKLAPRDVSATTYQLQIENFSYASQVPTHAIIDSAMRTPQRFKLDSEKTSAHSLSLSWHSLSDSHVQIELNGLIQTNIIGGQFTFHELQPETHYRLRIRSQYGNKVSDWSETIQAETKPDQMRQAIKKLTATSNLSSLPNHPLSNLIDFTTASDWLSAQSADPKKGSYLELTFTFDQAYTLSRMLYVPRAIDRLGHFLRLQVAISKDGQTFSEFSDPYNWPNDSKNKVIGLRDVTARSIKLRVLASVEERGSAREIVFFKAAK